MVHTLAFATSAVNDASVVPASGAPADALAKARQRLYAAYAKLAPASIDHMWTAWGELAAKQREVAAAIADGKAVDRFFAPDADKLS